MNTVRVGAVTIGQSPRSDVMPDLVRELGPAAEIVEHGALDALNLEQVRANPPKSRETTLVSRMSDGTEVKVERTFVVPRLQASIRAIERDVRIILVLCTAPFGGLDSIVPLLHPAQILDDLVWQTNAVRLGVVTPSQNQISMQHERWSGVVRDEVVVVAASPYTDSKGLDTAATILRDSEVDSVVMDCIGYTHEMRARLQSLMPTPVFSALGGLGGAAREMLGIER